MLENFVTILSIVQFVMLKFDLNMKYLYANLNSAYYTDILSDKDYFNIDRLDLPYRHFRTFLPKVIRNGFLQFPSDAHGL